MSNQMTLWNAESLGLSDRMGKAVIVAPGRNKEQELVRETLRLLPMNSKEHDSIASVFGVKGALLKERARELSDEAKTMAVHKVVSIGQSPNYTAQRSFMTMNRKGDVIVRFKRVATGIESLTREQLESRLAELKAQESNGHMDIESVETKPETTAKSPAKSKGNGKTAAAVAAK